VNWGSNGPDSDSPIAVAGLTTGVATIAAGENHTCALTTGGGVKCWGRNDYGQLGNDSYVSSAVPVDVHGLGSGVASVSAGRGMTCAVMVAGGVRCWGDNPQGQLGNGTTKGSPIPVDVTGLTAAATMVSAGDGVTCARLSDNTVSCWGDQTDGRLGNGTAMGVSMVPVRVPGFRALGD
jgi:alpha-tubulin suppressor-like RCC1 family protein